MTGLGGLQFREDIDAFITQVSKAVCKSHGLDPDAMYDVLVGYDDNGVPIVAEMPNWERFDHDVRESVGVIFDMPLLTVQTMMMKWDMLREAEAYLQKKLDDAPSDGALVTRMLKGVDEDEP